MKRTIEGIMLSVWTPNLYIIEGARRTASAPDPLPGPLISYRLPTESLVTLAPMFHVGCLSACLG
jgi:hypothetical protein